MESKNQADVISLSKTHKVTDIDVYLVESKLDVDEAKSHPVLLGWPTEEIENRIDRIYAAANTGNLFAKLLIETAAQYQAQEAVYQTEEFEPVDTVIDLTEYNYRLQSQESRALDEIRAAAELGCIIMKIESEAI